MDNRSIVSNTDYEFLEKTKDVTESFKEEFNMGDKSDEYVSTGPPPNMKRRKLILDSMRAVKDKGAGQGGGGVKGGSDNDGGGRYAYVFGAGYHGQLGRKASRGQKKYSNAPLPVLLAESVRQVSCGALHCAVTTDEGHVYTWGDGRYGQLGHLDEGFSNKAIPTLVATLSSMPIRMVSCGQSHTLAISEDGQVFSWGNNKHGQLGLGNRNTSRFPCNLESDLLKGKRIVDISCGDRHSLCVSQDGCLFTFGSGADGQLGHGNNHDVYEPKAVEYFADIPILTARCGSIHTAAVSKAGALYLFGFGDNLYGKDKANFTWVPLLIPFKLPISQVACGQSHVIILTDPTKSGGHGGTTTISSSNAVDSGTAHSTSLVSSSESSSSATGGDVYVWGDGNKGEIGNGTTKASQQPKLVLYGKNIISIAAGRYHSCAVSANGALYTWGCGDNGQLARMHDKQDNSTNTQKSNSLPKLCVSLLGSVVGEVSCGEHHTCVLASCRYRTLSDDVMEWAKLEEMEFQGKMNLLSSSKQRGRGVSKKDLQTIRRWRREEEERKLQKLHYDETLEQTKIQDELAKIIKKADLDETLSKTGTLSNTDMVNDLDLGNITDSFKASYSKPSGAVKKSAAKQSTGFSSTTLSSSVTSRSSTNLSQRISAKQAGQARSGFHERTRQVLSEMATQVFGVDAQMAGNIALAQTKKETEVRNKFAFRKEFDKLKLVSAKKEKKLRRLDEELSMLQEVEDSSELKSQEAELELKNLGMKLNTVMIKISEAERSKHTYELNITHIKDESQENHKQLDVLRRNLFHQESLRKKIAKFRDYAVRQRDFALQSLKEFELEFEDWKQFLEYQYRNMKQLQRAVHDHPRSGAQSPDKSGDSTERAGGSSNRTTREMNGKKREKILQRIGKLERLVETNEGELSELNDTLGEMEETISYFEARFEMIFEATNMNDCDTIIDKFFCNEQIHTEQQNSLKALEETKQFLIEEQKQLDSQLRRTTLEKVEHNWREVDSMQENLEQTRNQLKQSQKQSDQAGVRLTFTREWMLNNMYRLFSVLTQYDIPHLKPPHTFEVKPNEEIVEALCEYVELFNQLMDSDNTGFSRKK